MRHLSFVGVLLLVSAIQADPPAGDDNPPVVEDFSFSSTFDATGPLYARAIYPRDGRRLPIMLVQQGYRGDRTLVNYAARRMARRGFFCLCVQTRGWGGKRMKKGKLIAETERSAGDHDDGGVETHDLYDALNAAVKKYPDKVDPQRVSIVGYSYGGGMVYFAKDTLRFRFVPLRSTPGKTMTVTLSPELLGGPLDVILDGRAVGRMGEDREWTILCRSDSTVVLQRIKR